MKNDTSKSWFCVFNNPHEHGYDKLEPQQILEKLKEIWMEGNPQRTCALTYCVSSDGLNHIHAVFEDTKTMRFSAIKKLFPAMHIESTKGNKDDAENYIRKKGKFAEAGEKILFVERQGEIKGFQGSRRDLSVIAEFLDNGMTLNQILDVSFSYRRYEKMIRDAYYGKRERKHL